MPTTCYLLKNVQKNSSTAKTFLICQYIHNDLLLFKGQLLTLVIIFIIL